MQFKHVSAESLISTLILENTKYSCGTYRNFQTYGTVNKRSKKSDSPCSGRKLSAKSADNVKVRILCNDEREMPRSTTSFSN